MTKPNEVPAGTRCECRECGANVEGSVIRRHENANGNPAVCGDDAVRMVTVRQVTVAGESMTLERTPSIPMCEACATFHEEQEIRRGEDSK